MKKFTYTTFGYCEHDFGVYWISEGKQMGYCIKCNKSCQLNAKSKKYKWFQWEEGWYAYLFYFAGMNISGFVDNNQGQHLFNILSVCVLYFSLRYVFEVRK